MIEWKDNVFFVSGQLTIDSAKANQHLPFERNAQVGKQYIDMAQVESVDSAAVSLMLSWMRQAQALGLQLSFVHVPTNLRSLVDLYGLTDVLPLNYS